MKTEEHEKKRYDQMLRACYEKICSGEDLRASLIELKKQLKAEEGRKAFRFICRGNYDVIMKCLAEEDPKVRKNAAAILGELAVPEAVDVLMDAYLAEDQRFVRPEYVKAMAGLNCGEYLQEFRNRLQELSHYDAPENEKKHIREEMQAVRELLLKQGDWEKHLFTGTERTNEIILTTLPTFRDLLAESVASKKKLLKSGVYTVTDDIGGLLQNRLWQEMLFVLHGSRTLPEDPRQLAAWLKSSDLEEILQQNHSGDGIWYFRIGVPELRTETAAGDFVKKAARAVEEVFDGKLVNSASHYEMELRLLRTKDGGFRPYLKLFTLPDHRFDYRKYTVSAGMKPYLAAGLMALAKPFLKEYAQVLDPFCGAGTLLMERRFLMPVRNLYGLDIFGEAVKKARANAQVIGFQANYINRDFFDFTHEYLFDEIITDFPTGIGDRAETDSFYRRFFEKAAEHLTDSGRMILYSGEMGLIKKYLRLQGDFRLLREFCILDKRGMYLYILEKKQGG